MRLLSVFWNLLHRAILDGNDPAVREIEVVGFVPVEVRADVRVAQDRHRSARLHVVADARVPETRTRARGAEHGAIANDVHRLRDHGACRRTVQPACREGDVSTNVAGLLQH